MKSDIIEKETLVFFPVRFIVDLKGCLGMRREGAIFITRPGRQMSRTDIQQIYGKTFNKAKIKKKGFTHVLRATTITELSRYKAEEIINLSGHSALQMVGYYVKSGYENNPSRKINMV